MVSVHYELERKDRDALIQKIGYGKIIKRFFDEEKFYTISDTGIVTIMNKQTYLVITRLIARPNQLRRYYKDEKVPYRVMKQAIEHQRLGYNEI